MSSSQCSYKWERTEYERIKAMVKSGDRLTEAETKVYGRVLRKNARVKERERAEGAENKRVKLSAIAQRASEYTKLAKKRYEAAKKSNEAKLDEGDMSCSSGSSVERCRVSQQHSVGNQVAGAAVNPQEMSNEEHWCVIALPSYETCR